MLAPVRNSLLQRRAAIEQAAALHRAELLQADHVLAAIERLPDRIAKLRERAAAAPLQGPLLATEGVMGDNPLNHDLRRERILIAALDELKADLPAAKKHWEARRKQLEAYASPEPNL